MGRRSMAAKSSGEATALASLAASLFFLLSRNPFHHWPQNASQGFVPERDFRAAPGYSETCLRLETRTKAFRADPADSESSGTRAGVPGSPRAREPGSHSTLSLHQILSSRRL